MQQNTRAMSVMLFHKTMDRKDEIFQFICEFRNLKGYAPSLREIVTGTSVPSTFTVHCYLAKMEEDGLIRRAKRMTSALRFTSLA